MDAGFRDGLIANDIPVVLLSSEANVPPDDSFLQPTRPATLYLSLNILAKTAAFRIRVPFRVDQSHAALFVLVDPHSIRHIAIESHAAAVPEPVRQSLIAKGTSHGVISLRFQLEQAPTIVGPAGISRLHPTGNSSGNLLACLRLLSIARSLTIFVAENDLQMEQLLVLYRQVPDSTLRASPRQHALDTLYDDRGGKDIRTLLTPFTLRSYNSASQEAEGAMEPFVAPPAYDTPSSQRSAEKRLASSENLVAPHPKKYSAVVPASFPPPSNDELSQLRAEVNRLHKQVHNQPTPAEDVFILNRFDAIERRLSALESQQAAAATATAITVAQRLDAVESELANIRSTSSTVKLHLGALADAIAPHQAAALQLPADRDREYQQRQVEGSGRQIRWTRQLHADAGLLERQLQRWKEVCLVCKATGRNDGHSISCCVTEQGKRAGGEMRDMQGRITFDKFSGCFRCGVPQTICNRWESNGRGGFKRVDGKECQFYGVMMCLLHGIKYGYKMIWERWAERLEGLGVKMERDTELTKYLGQRWKEGRFESCNLAREVMWLIGEIESLEE